MSVKRNTSTVLLFASILLVLFVVWSSGLASADTAPAKASALADTLVVYASADSWVDQEQPATNFGGETSLQTGVYGTVAAFQKSTLVYFDLSNLPTNPQIVRATLEMYQTNAVGADPYDVWADAIFSPWDEATVTWGTQPSAYSLGDPPTSLDATDGWKRWDVTNIVANWAFGEISNYGIYMRGDGQFSGLHTFNSREASTVREERQYPRLVIEYVPARPTATRTPVPTWTPVPTNTPTPGPTPTATPDFWIIPYIPVFDPPIVYLPSDLSIEGVEITQGIQCFDTSNGLATCPDNSLPVVTKKGTTARVYLDISGGIASSMNNVPMRLHIRANNVWYTANTSGKATTTLNQGNSDSADVWFNVNFSNDVTVDFWAEVDPDNTIPESNESNNRYPAAGYITLTFRRSKTLDIVGQRLRYHPTGYGGTQYAGGWAVNGGAADWFEQLLPVRNGGIDYSVKSGYLNWTTSLGSGDGQHALISNLNSRWIMENVFSWLFGTGAFTGAEHVYGWAPSAGYSGGHADMPVYPHAGGLGVVGIGSDAPGTSTDNPGSGTLIFGHELVHDYDVFHTNTGGDDCGSNDSNSNFPYGTSSIQEFGYNPATGKIYTPSATHDLMSYCPAGGSKEGWISPFTWNKMFSEFDLIAAREANPEPGTPETFYTTGATESLFVSVQIFNPDAPDYDPQNPGQLGNLHRVTGGVEYLPTPGDYAIELRDAQGLILHTQTFTVGFESEYDPIGSAHPGWPFHPEGGDEPPFPTDPTGQADENFVIPWVDGTTTVVLRHGPDVFDQRTVSDNAPIVLITDPISNVTWLTGTTQTLTWEGIDLDDDALVYSVFYSSDGGGSWELLGSDLADPWFDLEVDSLAGTNDARLRVVATDGINIGFDETPAAISVPNKAPFATISEPGNGATFMPGALVVMQGAATDLEDGSLPDEAMHWSSDVQGSLGIGPMLGLNTLDPGWHTISLTVHDSYGISTTASTTIYIGYVIYTPVIQK